jgi:hypothetical protein
MLLLLACPRCLNARERETRDYQMRRACDDCGALLLLRQHPAPHLVLVCRNCNLVFEGVEGQPAPGMPAVCPNCHTRPGWPEK